MHVTHQKRAQHSWGQLHPQWLHLHALTCFQAKPCPSYTKGDTGGSHTGCAKPYSAQCGLQSLLYSHQTVSWNFWAGKGLPDHEVQPLPQHSLMFPSATSTKLLNPFMDGDSNTTLGSLCQS